MPTNCGTTNPLLCPWKVCADASECEYAITDNKLRLTKCAAELMTKSNPADSDCI